VGHSEDKVAVVRARHKSHSLRLERSKVEAIGQGGGDVLRRGFPFHTT